MSITLITAVPGGGKTAYAVWYEIKKANEQGRIIYTCGIPKLKIPTIELSYEELKKWYERDEAGDLPVLANIEKGALIVVDEVQKLWPAAGSKITDDIKDLSEHRHFGLSFVLITQSPTLIHRNVLALVDRHIHIRPNWSGRKLYEWPEYCRNPAASTNKNVAVVSSYKLPVKSFDLYHSSSQHIKPKKKIPMGFFIFLSVIFSLPVLGYYSYERIASKGIVIDEHENLQIDQINENVQIFSDESSIEIKEPEINETSLSTHLPTLLTPKYDWNRVSSCLSSEVLGCVCYGLSAERLAIPLETCQLATRHGWTQNKQPSI